MHEHVLESLLLGRRTKGNLVKSKGTKFVVFDNFFRLSKGAFCRKSLISTGRKRRLVRSRLLNLIGHIGIEARQFSI